MQVEEYKEIEILEASKKDPKAFEVVYNNYFDKILLFINKRVNDKEVAFDLTQQVFFNALTHLKSYKHKGFPFSSFLFKIAINECNQHFRDNNRIRYISIDEDSMSFLSADIPTLDHTEQSILSLRKAFQELKQKEVMLIELRYFEQRNFKEIAQLLNTTENNCKVRVHRIIKKLKKYFKDEE